MEKSQSRRAGPSGNLLYYKTQDIFNSLRNRIGSLGVKPNYFLYAEMERHAKNHFTNDPCSHCSRLQSTRTTSHPPFTPNQPSILPLSSRAGIHISSRYILCLCACLLIVCPNGRWNELLRLCCGLTTRNPQPLVPFCVAIQVTAAVTRQPKLSSVCSLFRSSQNYKITRTCICQ